MGVPQGTLRDDAGERDSGPVKRRNQRPAWARRCGLYGIAVSRDNVLIALHPLQRKTRSAVLIEIAGSLPMQFIGKPHPLQLGGGAVSGG
jgi:hypothetical protein